jgi:hypothetical protein
VVAVDAAVEIDFGTFDGVLQTLDFTPISPESLEQKYYAAGVGNVLVESVGSGNRAVLVDKLSPAELEHATISIAKGEGKEEAQLELAVTGEQSLSRIQVFGPEGELRADIECFSVDAVGVARAEIASAESALEELQKSFPEGDYLVVGWGMDGQIYTAEAPLTHE